MTAVADALDPDVLAARLAPLGRIVPLTDLALGRPELHASEMAVLVAQARELLTGYYVHLPLKRALYAVDPVGRLDLLAARVSAVERGSAPSIPEGEFHEELGSILAALRDLHTSYTLPEPHRSRIAFLPFLLEECDDGAGPVFPVTKAFGTFADPDFAPGTPGGAATPVVVTHWNGVPIDRAVMLHAERTGGSNRAARRARGVERLTFRWLGRLVRPDEDWVVVTYEVAGERRHLRFPWLVAERPPAAPASRRARTSLARGVDEEGEWLRAVKQELFADRGKWDAVPLPGLVAYREFSPPGEDRRFGHLRLFSFGVAPGEVPRYVRRIRRLVAQAPPDGLVIDLRGNPGGDIVAAEQLLQLLSPVPIQPLGMDFINTPAATALAEQVYRARGVQGAFDDVLREAAATAAQFLPSPPLEPRAAYNALGQAYQGPVALLVDALSYSAADVFSASFQDHDLGPVLGTDPQTGGGGGNVWPYESIRRMSGRPMPRTLPHGASFDVAVRRTTRVARRAGATLEDRGVVLAGEPTPLTSDDVLGGNERLLAAVVAALPGPPPCRLDVAWDGRARCFTLRTQGLARVDVVLDRRPPVAVAVTDPDGARVAVPDGVTPRAARFLGFTDEDEASRPVVSTRWRARAARGAAAAQGAAQST